jgi:thiol:disulfide interchange protein
MLHSVWRQRQLILLAILLLVVASPVVLAEEKIQWAGSIPEGLAEAKKTDKPIMMDFYTDW